MQKIYRRNQVEQATGLSRSTLYAKVSDGTFPKPIRLGPENGAVGWLENELTAWQAERVAERDAKTAKTS